MYARTNKGLSQVATASPAIYDTPTRMTTQEVGGSGPDRYPIQVREDE
jgi:hypothetical protein